MHAQPTFGPGSHAGMVQGERKHTSGTLNRNESQSQLTTSFEPLDQREVDLRIQRELDRLHDIVDLAPVPDLATIPDNHPRRGPAVEYAP